MATSTDAYGKNQSYVESVADLIGEHPLCLIEGSIGPDPRTAFAWGWMPLNRRPLAFLCVSATAVYLVFRTFAGKLTGECERLPLGAFPEAEGTWMRLDVGDTDFWVKKTEFAALAVARQVTSSYRGDHAYPARSVRGAFPSWIYTLMGVVAVFLGIDEFFANAAGRRASGIMLTMLGALTLGAAVALAFPRLSRAWRPLVSRLAGTASLLLGLLLAAIALASDTWWVFFWMLWVTLAAVSLRRLPEREAVPEPPPDPETGERRARERTAGKLAATGVTLAFGLTFILNTTQFAHSLLPSDTDKPTLQVTSAVERVPGGDTDTDISYVAKVEVENPTTSRVAVVGSLYRVSVVEFTAAPQEGLTTRAHADGFPPTELPHVRRSAEEYQATVVQFGPVTPSGWYLEPDEKYPVQRAVNVPRDLLRNRPAIRLTVELIVADGARLLVTAPGQWTQLTESNGDSQVQRTPIPPPGFLHRLTRGNQELVVTEWLSQPRDPNARSSDIKPTLRACITGSGKGSETCFGTSPDTNRWARYYNLVGTSRTFETPVGSVPPPPPAPVTP